MNNKALRQEFLDDKFKIEGLLAKLGSSEDKQGQADEEIEGCTRNNGLVLDLHALLEDYKEALGEQPPRPHKQLRLDQETLEHLRRRKDGLVEKALIALRTREQSGDDF